MKKNIVLFTAIFSAVFLTGCANTYKLTDRENDAIAEYIAGLLLSYDANYEQTLVQPEEEVEKPEETTKIEEETEKAEEESKDKVAGNAAGSTESNQQANADFTEVIGVPGISMKYVKYSLRENYTSDYYVLEPNKGEQLLVVEFDIINSYKTEKTLSLGSANIQYQLDVNSGTFIKPLLTFLDTDLRYLETTVPAKDKKTGILVFSVPKELKTEGMNLIISKESQTAIVKIK